MPELNYDYETCVRNSEKVSWTVDEVFPPGTQLDFSKPFLPDALSGAHAIEALDAREQLLLNQISGHAYVNLFAFVEEYIIATVLRHAQAEMHGDHANMRALLRFADEEVKHQDLFNRYMEAFAASFGSPCKVLDNAVAVAGVILSKTPLAVLMITLHLELMTQAHYTESIRKDSNIDPQFASLLKHHWLEEAQHARIDVLELNKYASMAPPELITQAFHEYLELTDAVSGLLEAQANLDVESLEAATGKTYSDEHRKHIASNQYRAYRHTFLVLGMTNKQFIEFMIELSPEGAARIAEKAQAHV